MASSVADADADGDIESAWLQGGGAEHSIRSVRTVLCVERLLPVVILVDNVFYTGGDARLNSACSGRFDQSYLDLPADHD